MSRPRLTSCFSTSDEEPKQEAVCPFCGEDQFNCNCEKRRYPFLNDDDE